MNTSAKRKSSGHDCPACGAGAINPLRKFIAGILFPVKCPECGSLVEMTGVVWDIASFLLGLSLILSAVFALFGTVDDVRSGAILFASLAVFWLIAGLAAVRFGRLSVCGACHPPNSALTDPATGLRGSVLARLLSGGLLSGIAVGVRVIAFYGFFAALIASCHALAALCFAICIAAGPAMHRLSPVIEKMHQCPVCGELTISSWSKGFSFTLILPKCPKCESKYMQRGFIGDRYFDIDYVFLFIVPIAALYFQSFLIVVMYGIFSASSMAFAIKYVPIVEDRRKLWGRR